jgi:hypothetical protein
MDADIWEPFQESGFEFYISAEPYQVHFDEEKCRRTPAFQGFWSLGFFVDKLSERGKESGLDGSTNENK